MAITLKCIVHKHSGINEKYSFAIIIREILDSQIVPNNSSISNRLSNFNSIGIFIYKEKKVISEIT